MQRYGFLGCDVSKGYCDFILLNSIGHSLNSGFKLDDNQQGHQYLYKKLADYYSTYDFDKIIIGVESTGGYENNWYNGLKQKGKALKLEVFRINPKLIYHSGKSDGVLSISDRVSAKSVANYLRKNYGQGNLTIRRLNNTNDDTKGARGFYKYIQTLVNQQTRIMNMMEKTLYSLVPELLALKGEKYCQWFLELLIKYPGKGLILGGGIKGLTKIKYLSKQKAKKVIAAIETSVGRQEDHWDMMVLREQAEEIKGLSIKIERLKQEHVLQVQEVKNKEMEIITSIRGIADNTAASLIMEIGEIQNYESGKNLVAFFGINPTIKQSGDSTYRIGMSKAGSSTARSLMYMAAKNVVIHEPYFKSIYHKHAKKGKKYNDIMGIIMSKVTRIIYGMLTNEQHFDAGVDVFNQEKEQNNPRFNHSEKDENNINNEQIKQDPAPLSWREKRKRKQEHLAPS